MKSCPFCGNKDLRKLPLKSGNKIIGYHVVCEPDFYPCGAQGPIKNTQRAATIAWNKREKK